MTIVCATNFSPESIATSTFAARLAAKAKETLWLVYVLPKDAARVLGTAAAATAEGALSKERTRTRELGATTQASLLIGGLHRELPPFVTEHGASVVLAGESAHVPGGESGTLARLGRQLEVPLWTMRDPAKWEAWLEGQHTLKVMVGVDQSHSTDAAAKWVEWLAKWGKLEVLAGHIYFPAAESHRRGLHLPHSWDDASAELVDALHGELALKLPKMLSTQLRLRPAIGRTSNHLIALADEEKADLLVLGTHHRKALGRLFSVSEQCLHSASMSVVAVPTPQTALPLPSNARPVDRVLIASDFSAVSANAIPWGLGILAAGGHADLVHVSPEPLSKETERKVVERLMAQVDRSALRPGCTVEGHALTGEDVAGAIVMAAERFTSGVICLGARGDTSMSKWVFGSTSHGVLERSKRTVMIVPPAEA